MHAAVNVRLALSMRPWICSTNWRRVLQVHLLFSIKNVAVLARDTEDAIINPSLGINASQQPEGGTGQAVAKMVSESPPSEGKCRRQLISGTWYMPAPSHVTAAPCHQATAELC